MSCFGGQMDIYKNFAIDRFDGFNLDARQFFLSHCHSDHMIGLDSELLFNTLKKKNTKKIFMSEITKVLVLADNRYKHLKPYLVDLPIEEPKLINHSDDDSDLEDKVLVTLLPAAHCLGSVMFLFEGNEGSVLYTGDFRLPKGSAARMKFLHTGANVKKIDHVHFDSTFCIPEAFFIPSREQCLDSIISVIRNWISKGPTHVARLRLSAKYGYEYLFEELHKEFKKKIYCARARFYKSLPHISRVLTSDPLSTQIYAGFKNESLKSNHSFEYQEKGDFGDADKTLKAKRTFHYLNLTLSTLYFTHAASPEEIRVKIDESNYRACFSFHSSLSEVCDFLSHIKPLNIHANVIPRPSESFQSVENRMRKMCFGALQRESNSSDIFKPIGKLTRKQPNHDTVPDRFNDRKRNKFLLEEDSDDEYTPVIRKRIQK